MAKDLTALRIGKNEDDAKRERQWVGGVAEGAVIRGPLRANDRHHFVNGEAVVVVEQPQGPSPDLTHRPPRAETSTL
ncbi:hypothetical protein [Jatrophihabitans sp. GAS493]|uniref:hypothetical protein n=1 Tax=Jatrophihabitans sp. GAS493 TaxID=1907575 RepID=UPI001F53DD1C|nr:hypothetical protein [Jatrophihabitans sp. GAS493]